MDRSAIIIFLSWALVEPNPAIVSPCGDVVQKYIHILYPERRIAVQGDIE